jgi:hypothetical protein
MNKEHEHWLKCNKCCQNAFQKFKYLKQLYTGASSLNAVWVSRKLSVLTFITALLKQSAGEKKKLLKNGCRMKK